MYTETQIRICDLESYIDSVEKLIEGTEDSKIGSTKSLITYLKSQLSFLENREEHEQYERDLKLLTYELKEDDRKLRTGEILRSKYKIYFDEFMKKVG